MKVGRVPGKSDILVRLPAGNVLFPALLYESGFKTEFGYDDRKGVGACDRGPSRARNARGKDETRLATPKASKDRPGGDVTFHVHRLLYVIHRSVPQPGTQCQTSATSLRKQLANSV